MALRRLAVAALIAVAVFATLLATIVLYLAFADLGRHKTRIETFVTQQTGRSFTIEGPLKLKLLPSISVEAEKVRLANPEWGSQPSMVYVGRFAMEVSLWSLISGPARVRSIELRDVSVALEKSANGEGNWVLGGRDKAEGHAESLDSGATAIPIVIERGDLSNIGVTYREPGKANRVVVVETLSVGPGTAGLLAIAEKGSLEKYPTTLTGEVGPLDALLSGRDIRMAIKASVGNLRLALDGSVGRLDPLRGATVNLTVENPDLGAMLRKLQLPVIATGALNVNVRLSEAGEQTRLDLDAKVGDIAAKANGTLRTLGLAGSDLLFAVTVPDAARVASVFGANGVPAGVLEGGGRVAPSGEELRLTGITVTLAGAKAKADGTLRMSGDPGAAIRFDVTAENLARLREGLPKMPFRASGTYAGGRDKIELSDLQSRFGETEISGKASMLLTGRKRFDAELASPHVDLTPWMGGGARSGSAAKAESVDAADKTREAGKKSTPRKEFVFGSAPLQLPFDKLRMVDAGLSLSVGELKLGTELLKNVKLRLKLDSGNLQLDTTMADDIKGTADASVRLIPSDGGADLTLAVDAKDVRPASLAGDVVDRSQVPGTSLKMNVRMKGASPRQMAASANGEILVTQGRGRIKSGVVDTVGSDILAQLAGSLNPFAAKDPYTELECTVVKAQLVDGKATIVPVLMQSSKVAVIAAGVVDLHTEKLTFDFNTRPREGIGISAGMFTNPFVELGGTLANPKLAMGTKGALSGALAVATGGLSVVAKGAADRVAGEASACAATLAKATGVAATAEGTAEEKAKQ